VARTLLATLERPFALDGRQVAVSASLGVATADPGLGAEQAPALVHRSDVAMYAVKTSGKGGVAAHREVLGPRRALPAQHRALAGALERGAARVVFRPVVDVEHGRVAALEVLARWADQDTGSPRPGPAPTSALLEPACRQLAAWNAMLGHHRLRVLVAVAVAELDDPQLPVRVDRVLARHRLSPGQLTLEIDDGALPDRTAGALDALHRLRHLGVRLGLGGLGSGYATLAWLSGAPLDTVRIDRELVADIDHDPARCRLLRGVLALTRHLGLRSVADGVERTGQLLELRRLGCDLVLGHLVAGPATAAELTPVVLAQQPLLPRGLLVPTPSTVGAT
jgi:predicted signal transduction protein with EAL and GGDEF domain